MHWRVRSEEKEKVDYFFYEQWLKLNRVMFLKPIKIHYDIYFSITRRRDFDNYIAGTKFFNDAVKRTFTVRDDSKWIVGLSVSFHQGDDKTVVTIQEA
jgi:Holliday junction resolvase RusA-like endonuclease